MNIIPKVWIKIQLLITTVGCATSFRIATKDMDNAMLNLFCDVRQVHVLAASCRALDLEVISVILVEPLQRLYEKEIHSQPKWIVSKNKGNHLRI